MKIKIIWLDWINSENVPGLLLLYDNLGHFYKKDVTKPQQQQCNNRAHRESSYKSLKTVSVNHFPHSFSTIEKPLDLPIWNL